jgi:hypothetical protein
MTAELARLRRIVEADRQFDEMNAGNYVTLKSFDQFGGIDVPGSAA